MNPALISSIRKIFGDEPSDCHLRVEVVDLMRHDLQTSEEETEMIVNHLCGESYLAPVVVYQKSKDQIGLRVRAGLKLGTRLRGRPALSSRP